MVRAPRRACFDRCRLRLPPQQVRPRWHAWASEMWRQRGSFGVKRSRRTLADPISPRSYHHHRLRDEVSTRPVLCRVRDRRNVGPMSPAPDRTQKRIGHGMKDGVASECRQTPRMRDPTPPSTRRRPSTSGWIRSPDRSGIPTRPARLTRISHQVHVARASSVRQIGPNGAPRTQATYTVRVSESEYGPRWRAIGARSRTWRNAARGAPSNCQFLPLPRTVRGGTAVIACGLDHE